MDVKMDRKITIRLNEDALLYLNARAETEERSRSDIIRRMLADDMKRRY